MAWSVRDGAWRAVSGDGLLQRVGRVLVIAAAVSLFVYCALRAWDALQILRYVKLVQFRDAFEILTVGDVILCVVAYGLGKEIARGLLGRQR